MKIRIRLVGGLMLAAVSTVMLGSCVSDKDSAGLEYMPDMYRSPAIEPYVDYGEVRNKQYEDMKMSQSALTPPYGTIPYFGNDAENIALMLSWNIDPFEQFKITHGLVNYNFSKDNTYETEASLMTVNPYRLTANNADDIFANGKKLYTANCAHCHGAKGDGNGQMVEIGVYAGVPDYANKTELSTGQLFYSIYYGKGSMGAHASIVNKKEIWTLVHYIRRFQDPEYGKALEEAAKNGGTIEAAPVEEMDWEHVNLDEQRGHHMGLHILYESGSANMEMGKSIDDLNHVFAFMEDNPEVKIELAGHTDPTGVADDNMTLSAERAKAVKAWIVEKGIDSSRIIVQGYGQTMPVVVNGSVDNDASRRTELIIK